MYDVRNTNVIILIKTVPSPLSKEVIVWEATTNDIPAAHNRCYLKLVCD